MLHGIRRVLSYHFSSQWVARSLVISQLQGGIFIAIGWTYYSHLPIGSQLEFLYEVGSIQSRLFSVKEGGKITKLWLTEITKPTMSVLAFGTAVVVDAVNLRIALPLLFSLIYVDFK